MYSFGNSAEKAYLEMKARGLLAHCFQIRKKSSNGSKYHYRVYFWLQEGIFTVFTIMGNIPDPKDWLLIGIGLSSEDHIFSFFFWFSSSFSLFLLRKGHMVLFSIQFKVLWPFWCPFSRSDCHTPTNYLRSHLEHRSTKILLWAVTLQI